MANIILRAEGDKNGEECNSKREINCEKVSKKVLYKKLNSQKKTKKFYTNLQSKVKFHIYDRRKYFSTKNN